MINDLLQDTPSTTIFNAVKHEMTHKHYRKTDVNHQSKNKEKTNQELTYKIGIAGFCFVNILLLSFPDYLGIDESFTTYRLLLRWTTLVLVIPTFFYSGLGYLKNAFIGIKQRRLNIDLPIALGMIMLLGISSYEIITHTGSGYANLLAGLIFFLLVGKWLQKNG